MHEESVRAGYKRRREGHWAKENSNSRVSKAPGAATRLLHTPALASAMFFHHKSNKLVIQGPSPQQTETSEVEECWELRRAHNHIRK